MGNFLKSQFLARQTKWENKSGQGRESWIISDIEKQILKKSQTSPSSLQFSTSDDICLWMKKKKIMEMGQDGRNSFF